MAVTSELGKVLTAHFARIFYSRLQIAFLLNARIIPFILKQNINYSVNLCKYWNKKGFNSIGVSDGFFTYKRNHMFKDSQDSQMNCLAF